MWWWDAEIDEWCSMMLMQLRWQMSKLVVFLFVAPLASSLCAARFPQALLLGSHSNITVMKCGTYIVKNKKLCSHIWVKWQVSNIKSLHGKGHNMVMANHSSKHTPLGAVITRSNLLISHWPAINHGFHGWLSDNKLQCTMTVHCSKSKVGIKCRFSNWQVILIHHN